MSFLNHRLLIRRRRCKRLTKFPPQSSSTGQTMIEILIVTLIVATVLTALAGGLTLSVKNTAQSKQRSLATSFAQEALEIFHREQYALGWSTFYQTLSSGTYCFNQLPANSTEFTALSEGECAPDDYIEGTNFQREVSLTVGAEVVTVNSTVTWFDGGTAKEVSVEQSYQNID